MSYPPRVIINFALLVYLTSFSSSVQIFEHNRAEKYTNYWYKNAQEDLETSLKIEYLKSQAKHVILFLGDGMSLTTLTAARILQGQKSGRSGEEGKLFFESFPHASLIKTYNVDRQVPDSAGTATAFLCGVKGNYETIGVNGLITTDELSCEKVRKNQVPSIMHWAVEAGKSTGIVTTARITHATPAAAYAHSPSRNLESDENFPAGLSPCKDIARQLVEEEPGKSMKVLMGGGRRHFLPPSSIDPKANKKGLRKDSKSLIEKWRNMRIEEGLTEGQFAFVNSTATLNNINYDKIEYLLGLFSHSHMSYDSERDRSGSGEPSISDMTVAAVKILRKNPKGFLLLVEGGRIDHAHHQNWASHALHETIAMDDAIRRSTEMLDMTQTLITVTADHSHTLTINGYPPRGQSIFGLSDTNETNSYPFTTLMYGNGPGHQNPREDPTDLDTANNAYRSHSAVHLNESNHGGEDVPLYAKGPFSHLFHGLHDQTYVAHVIAYASCIGSYQKKEHCTQSSSAPLNFDLPAPLYMTILFTLIQILYQ